jgi:REP element-mobilizing transposase RayT
VDRAIRDTCSHRGWEVLALNVRTNHVHVVLSANIAKERVLSDLKAWATRKLRESGMATKYDQVWAHHGSTRVLATEAAVEAAVQYVLLEQRTPLD